MLIYVAYIWFKKTAYSKILEEDVAPLVLDISEDHEDTDDHAEDDRDHYYQTTVN